jgi:hypothetical protein
MSSPADSDDGSDNSDHVAPASSLESTTGVVAGPHELVVEPALAVGHGVLRGRFARPIAKQAVGEGQVASPTN